MPKRHPSTGSNPNLVQSEERHSKLSQDECEVGVSLTPNREAPVDCIHVALIGVAPDPRCFDSSPVHITEGRIVLGNCDRVSSQKRYCLEG